jgi:hypothetical protein
LQQHERSDIALHLEIIPALHHPLKENNCELYLLMVQTPSPRNIVPNSTNVSLHYTQEYDDAPMINCLFRSASMNRAGEGRGGERRGCLKTRKKTLTHEIYPLQDG